MRFAFALCLLAALGLAACDSGEAPTEDLFLLSPLRVEDSFSFPTDSLVTLPEREFTLSYTFSGAGTTSGQVLPLDPVAAAEVGAYVQSLGYTMASVRQTQLTEPPALTLVTPAGENLSVFSNLRLSAFLPGHTDVTLGTRSISSGMTTIETTIPVNTSDLTPYLSTGPFSPRLSVTLRRAALAGSYQLVLRVNLSIEVDAAPTLGGTVVRYGGDTNIRDDLQAQGFDVGDIERARLKTITITEASSSDPLATRVQSIEVRMRSSAAAGDAVSLGRVTTFGTPVTVDRDVADLLTRTGRVQLVAVVTLRAGIQPDENYRFTVETETAVEVPLPTGTGD